MKLSMPQDHLVRNVRGFARAAVEHRQVARRTRDLLPVRLRKLKEEHQRSKPIAKAWMSALVDNRYLEFVDEYVKLAFEAHHARVQYETHMMLVEARRSLRRR